MREKMAEQSKDTTNWPDMFVGLYDRLTGRNAEISYAFDNLEIDIPASTAANAPKANWKFNGTLRITTKDLSK
ncbi:MAG: hypothetical protein HKP41_08770 [Desulfobacterales bacterium]|jgi:hypothetical protein|nr:hypothetical protein [Desulfobacterales bacterium]